MHNFQSRNRVALVIIAFSIGAATWTLAQPPHDVVAPTAPSVESGHSFVRADNPDSASQQIFRAMGVASVGFTFRTPPGKAAVITAIVRDARGKRIPRLSGRAVVNPSDDMHAASGVFRITRIDPGVTTESYKGNVRWELSFGNTDNSTGLNFTAIPSWQSEGDNGLTTQWRSDVNVTNLKEDHEYPIWEHDELEQRTATASNPSERRGTPLTCKYQVRVTFVVTEATNADGQPIVYGPFDDDE
ncbi:MAG TPA: hypothetical protein VMV10_03550 [Pirellulales bacterium]|nr:hypothetical protein [Pirellulales bacterium]